MALIVTLRGSNNRCIEQIFMVPKRFEPSKFDCIRFISRLNCSLVSLHDLPFRHILDSSSGKHKYVLMYLITKVFLFSPYYIKEMTGNSDCTINRITSRLAIAILRKNYYYQSTSNLVMTGIMTETKSLHSVH